METYGKRLAIALLDKGIEQKRLAEELGVPRQSVSRIINGKQFLDFDTAIKACKYLGITLEWLAFGQEDTGNSYHQDPERQRIEYLLSIMKKNSYPELITAMERILEKEMRKTISGE